jgi:hypothetical protein
MPSTRRRMALTLSEDLERVLFDLAEVLDKPAAKVATEMLTEMIPQLEGLAKIHRATKAGNKVAAKAALRHMVGDSMAELMAQSQPDMFTAKKAKKS